MKSSIAAFRNLAAMVFVVLASTHIGSAFAALGPGGGVAVATTYNASPPQVVVGADPFFMIDLSVELTQQAEGYTDAQRTYSTFTCAGRASKWNGSTLNGNGVGVCFKSSETYIGYFDPKKCYTYTTGDGTAWQQQAKGPYPANGITSSLNPPRFVPSRAADANHECGNTGEFSGNFLNWSTMTALDEFRAAMTGGARLVDTDGSSAQTFLIRTYRYADWSFVPKVISSATSANALAAKDSGGATYITSINKVTPWNVTSVRISNGNPSNYSGQDDSAWVPGQKVRFYDNNNNLLGEYDVTVEACKTATGITPETNCATYTDGSNTWYKPEGLLQKNALKMSYALTSYTGRSGNLINGGVLRSNAKYIGYLFPTSNGGLQTNPIREIDSSGRYVFDPDSLAGKIGFNGVAPVNSGILNYINQFALYGGKYKANDPDAELYYEGLRYIMNLGPTNSFWNPPAANGGALSALEQDGYPIFGAATSGSPAWLDPINPIDSSTGYPVTVTPVNPLTGLPVTSCKSVFALYVGDQFPHRNDYLPGGYSLAADDPTCTTECNDAVAKGINVSGLEDLLGGASYENYFSKSTNRGRNDGYGMAALAYWARTHNVHDRVSGAAAATTTQTAKSVKTYIVDTQEYNTGAATGKSNGLWEAAKYGGFNTIEPNASNNIDLTATPSQWDANGDGNPDTYTLASNPADMVAGLTASFDDVLSKTSSSAAAAVVANTSTGVGAIYQALYEPKITDGNSNAVTWVGTVRAFFIDTSGNFREDTDSNGQLTSADNVITFYQDSTQGNATFANLYSATGYSSASTPLSTGVRVKDLKPIWDAGQKLAQVSDANIPVQRTYTASAAGGRYIFTWIDTNGNGTIDAGEVQDFTSANFPAIAATNNDSTFDPARLLNLDSTNGVNATSLVNYIRGLDTGITSALNWRSRTIAQPGINSGVAQTLRLGDTVHSAPLVVGSPNQTYEVTYGDDSYDYYKQQYKNRRQVVYVGGNDGMLHAFNAGFYSIANNAFYNTKNAVNDAAQSPLGSELWAYVPYNLLPHLSWLTSMQYGHTYYVDGSPQSFDVNIFNDCASNTDPATLAGCTHPYGWGTILVVGFRLGGGEITVNANTDQAGATDPGNRTLRPAYLVFDVTDPEKSPVLLGELSNSSLGYTIGQPTVAKMRSPSNGSYKLISTTDTTHNRWYLIFGSGPNGSTSATKQQAHDDAVSNQNALVYVYDLVAKSFAGSGSYDTTKASSFVGGFTAADWALNYSDEVIYFGTVGGSVANPTGSLMRLQMPSNFTLSSTPTMSDVLTGVGTDQPFSAPPLPVSGPGGQPWVFAGTGRFYVAHDVTASKQMSYYGVKEPTSSGALSFASVNRTTSLVNTSGFQVFNDGTVQTSAGATPSINSASVGTYGKLKQAVDATSGWVIDFPDLSTPTVFTQSAYTRNVDSSVAFNGVLAFIEYMVSNDPCSPPGRSALQYASMLTGTGIPDATITTGTHNGIVDWSTDLGVGQSLMSGVFRRADGTPVVVTTDAGGGMSASPAPHFTSPGKRMSWREIPLP